MNKLFSAIYKKTCHDVSVATKAVARELRRPVETCDLILLLLLLPSELAFASVESSLSAVQEKLVGTLLPLAAICGLVIAGFSFVAGRPNARSHLGLAILGAIIGFGAESIITLIRSVIH